MHKPELVAPIQHFVADRIVYPVMKAANSESIPEDALREKATARASLLTKGAVMVGTGFASHLPIQLAMNGGFHMKEFKQAALGKSIGMVSAIAGIGALDYVAPNVMKTAEKSICGTLTPLFPDEQGGGKKHNAPKEICQLALIEIPSSVVSGLINYRISRAH